jgi:hypothetical protein
MDTIIYDSKFWNVKNTYLASSDHHAKSVTPPHLQLHRKCILQVFWINTIAIKITVSPVRIKGSCEELPTHYEWCTLEKDHALSINWSIYRMGMRIIPVIPFLSQYFHGHSTNEWTYFLQTFSTYTYTMTGWKRFYHLGKKCLLHVLFVLLLLWF